MYLTIFFWLALFLPGYAAVRRFFRGELESGVVGTIALSYFLSLGLVSPLAAVGYLLRVPVSVFAALVLALIVAAAIDLTRTRSWGPLAALVRGPGVVGLAILAIDMIVGIMVGGHTMGDARVHLVRIRFLVDHGLSNVDPFVQPEYFYPIYHTNLLHALHAACVKLTGVHHVAEWMVSLAWAKLLVTSGLYYLGFSVFRNRLAGWATALFSLVIWGSVPHVLYPNKIAPLFVCAVMFGVVVRILAGDCTWRRCALLAIGSLLLGQIHALYGAFAALAFGAPLAGRLIHAAVRRRAGLARLIVALLCLSPSGPFLAVASMNARPMELTSAEEDSGDAASADGLHRLENGWVVYQPKQWFGDCWWYTVPLLVAGAALALTRRDRAGSVALLAVFGTVAAVLFVPPLCSALLALTGRAWIVGRFSFMLRLGFIAIVAGSIASLIDSKVRSLALRGVLLVLITLAALPLSDRRESLSWPGYGRKLWASGQRRSVVLEGVRTVEAFAGSKIERGATVLTTPRDAVPLVMLVDCSVIAAYSSNNGVPDLDRRFDDIGVMLDGAAPIERRGALIRKYDVRYFLSTEGESPRWPGDWVKDHWFKEPWLIIELDRDAIDAAVR